MINELIGSFLGGGGGGSGPNQGVERFNTLCIEFVTKLKRYGKFGEKSTQRLDKILELAKQDSPVPFNLFKGGSKKESLRGLVDKNDSKLFDDLPILDRSDFEALNAKTQKASWKYIKKLLKITDESPMASMDLNSIGDVAASAFQDLDFETVGKTAYQLLDNVKGIFRRHSVDEKKFLDVTEDLVEAIPPVGTLEPKNYAGKARKFVRSVLFTDEWNDPLKKNKKQRLVEAPKNKSKNEEKNEA